MLTYNVSLPRMSVFGLWECIEFCENGRKFYSKVANSIHNNAKGILFVRRNCRFLPNPPIALTPWELGVEANDSYLMLQSYILISVFIVSIYLLFRFSLFSAY